MLKAILFIEKAKFDDFYQWLTRLNQGVLSDCPIRYSTREEGFEEALSIYLEPDLYSLVQDAEADLAYLREEYGSMTISFDTESGVRDLSTIKNILRNARKNDVEEHVVFTALQVMTEVPGILPLEAMIIAEREWIVANKEESV